MLAHPGDAGRERLGQQEMVEELPPVVPQTGGGSSLVAAVERPEEVSPVTPVEQEERRGLPHQVGDETGPFGRRQVAGGQPGVGIDHVGGDEGVLQIEGGQVTIGGEHGGPRARRPVGFGGAGGRGAHPGVFDDRRQVDVVDIGGPVDDTRVEAEQSAVLLVHPAPQGQQAVHPVAGLGLGVGAVELDVAQGPVGQEVLFLEGGHPGGLAPPDGQGPDQPLGQVHGLRRPGQLALDPPSARERPFGHDDGLAVGVVQGVLGEPLGHQLDQAPVAERVPYTGGHVVDAGTLVVVGRRRQCLPGHGQDGRHHQVHGDHVGHPFGDAGKFTEQTAGIGDDDGLGHPEAPDPPRPGLGQRRLDDGGADDGHGHGGAELGHQGPFAERLGVRVGIGPPEGLGPRLTGFDHLGLHPVSPDSLGPFGQQVETGPPELAPGLLGEARQTFGTTGLGIEIGPVAAGGVDFFTPLHFDGEAVALQQLLFGLPLVGAGHVGGRDRQEVDGTRPTLTGRQLASHLHGRRHPGRTEEVDLDGGVEGGVEADGGGRMDHDVALREPLAAGLVESETIGGDIPGHGLHPGGHLGLEAVAELVAEAVEAVVPQDLLGGPLPGGRTTPGADQQDDLAVGNVPENALHQGCSQKSGGPGDEEPLAGQSVTHTGHRICLPYGK